MQKRNYKPLLDYFDICKTTYKKQSCSFAEVLVCVDLLGARLRGPGSWGVCVYIPKEVPPRHRG